MKKVVILHTIIVYLLMLRFNMWNILISRINTSNEDAQKFAQMISKIPGVNIDLQGDSFGGNLEDKYSYLIIVCRIKSIDVTEVIKIGREILNTIPGNVKLEAYACNDNENREAGIIGKELFLSKYKSLFGISFHLMDKLKKELNPLLNYIYDKFGEHYHIVFMDESYLNIIVEECDLYCIDTPIIKGNSDLSCEIFPWLEGNNFPRIDNGIRWKVVPIKSDSYWDISGDDSSLDPRYW